MNKPSAEEMEQALGRLTGVLKDAAEFAATLWLLLLIAKVDTADIDALTDPWVAAFAKSRGLSTGDVWTLLFTLGAHLAKTPWAYFVLSPEGSDGDVGRVIKLAPASDKGLALLLDKGLEKYSFDRKGG